LFLVPSPLGGEGEGKEGAVEYLHPSPLPKGEGEKITALSDREREKTL